MIRGETVKVLRPSVNGMDAYNTPIRKWSKESVDNVLVGSPSPDDVATSAEPDGLRVSLPLYFPRSYHGALRGCRVGVRGTEYQVVGDPMPLDGGLTPTAWNMQVNVSRDDGR